MPPSSTYKDPIMQQASGLYKKYKRDAKRHKRVFELTFKEFLKITSTQCSYCGIPPAKLYRNNLKSKSVAYLYNGIDRMDSSKGYLNSNVTACCEDCNFFKSNRSAEDFVLKCQRVALYNGISVESISDETASE